MQDARGAKAFIEIVNLATVQVRNPQRCPQKEKEPNPLLVVVVESDRVGVRPKTRCKSAPYDRFFLIHGLSRVGILIKRASYAGIYTFLDN